MADNDRIVDSVLRPGVEAAVEFARRLGPDDEPPPSQIQPLLRFAKLPPAALRAARQAIQSSDEFRERVADALVEDDVGEAAWLWLRRPDEWERQFGEIVETASAEAAAARAELDERDIAQRLTSAERAAERWEREVEELGDAVMRLEAEGASLVADRDDLRRLNEEYERDLARLEDERSRAVRELKETEARLVARTEEVRALTAEREVATLAGRPEGGDESDRLDRATIVKLVGDALSGLDDLDGALASLAELVTDDGRSSEDGAPRRRPLRIGKGLADDSADGARWLLDQGDVLVFVDGYNLTMTAWPHLGATDQRRALERGLAALHGRTSAEFLVVFDGAEVAAHGTTTSPGVRVRFTEADVEADDEILRMLALVPFDRPLVVISDDRRVRDGARQGGANVVGSQQFEPLLTGS